MISELTSNRFINALKIIHENPHRQYLHRAKNHLIETFNNKKAHYHNHQKYHPLHYRDIVHLCHRFKNDIASDKANTHVVLDQLTTMKEHKISRSQKVFILASVIQAIWDCFQNWRKGFTWRSTLSVASDLMIALHTALPENHPMPKKEKTTSSPPISETPPIVSDVKAPKKETQLIITPVRSTGSATEPVGTKPKNRQLSRQYTENALGSSIREKMVVFLAAKTMESKNLAVSFLEYLKESCPNKELSLTGNCAIIVHDAYLYGFKSLQEGLSEWLKTQPTMNKKLWLECLQALNDAHNEHTISIPALVSLLELYKDNKWEDITITHPFIRMSMSILLTEAPDDKRVAALVRNFASRPEFTFEQNKEWRSHIHAYKKTIGTKGDTDSKRALKEVRPNWNKKKSHSKMPFRRNINRQVSLFR